MVIHLDPRVVAPELARFETPEIQQATALLNTILRRKINLATGPDQQQAQCLFTVIETLRGIRQKSVQFGAQRAADMVSGSTSLSQARRRTREYAHGKNAEGEG